jgi:hypothetical protein
MYRVGLSPSGSQGSQTRASSLVPESWGPFEITYGSEPAPTGRGGAASERGGTVRVDGVVRDDGVIPLLDDGQVHSVDVVR